MLLLRCHPGSEESSSPSRATCRKRGHLLPRHLLCRDPLPAPPPPTVFSRPQKCDPRSIVPPPEPVSGGPWSLSLLFVPRVTVPVSLCPAASSSGNVFPHPASVTALVQLGSKALVSNHCLRPNQLTFQTASSEAHIQAQFLMFPLLPLPKFS